MWRRLARCAVHAFGLTLCAVVLGTTGCGSDGSYTVRWQYFASPDATADDDRTVEAVAACGPHGVDAILVTAASSEGDGHQTTGLCTAGILLDGIGTGQWQFTLQQIDVRGVPIPPPDGAADPELSDTVKGGETADLGLVTFAPRRACADGVDNDHDGRVDLDDADCAGSASGDSEAPAPAPAPLTALD